jgi:hypothetical protein
MFGTALSVPVPDLDRTQYLLLLGADPLVSNGSLMTAPDVRGKLRAIKARGGRVVVIDPRRSRTAGEATAHHFIRPGTDAHFLLGLVTSLARASCLGTVAEHVNGVDEVRRSPATGRPRWPPPRAASPPTSSGGSPASSRRRSARPCTAASAPARRSSGPSRRGSSTC